MRANLQGGGNTNLPGIQQPSTFQAQRTSNLKQPSTLKSKLAQPQGKILNYNKIAKTATQANNPYQQIREGINQQQQQQYSQLPSLSHNLQKVFSQAPQIQRPNTSQVPVSSNIGLQQQNSQGPVTPSNASPYQPIALIVHKIIGTTSNSEDNFIILSSSDCIYLSQSFIVFFNFLQNKQILHFQNPNNKPYRSLYYNKDKQLLFVGEGSTKQGEIHVLRIQQQVNSKYTIDLVMILKGHRYGVNQIKSEGDLVVSVGDENDKGILVWETMLPRILSANLVKNSVIHGSQFIKQDKEDIEQFITYGSMGHLKIWSIGIEQDQKMKQYDIKNYSEIKPGQNIPKLIGFKIKVQENQERIDFTKAITQGNFIFLIGVESNKCSIYKLNLKTLTLESTFKLPYTLEPYGMIQDNSTSNLIISGSFKRLQLFESQSLKLSTQTDFSWAQPPQKGQLQMISQEIYDYLIQTMTQKDTNFSEIKGLIINNGIMVQILEDGMILFHDYEEKKLLRVLIQHSDTINDLIIKEYQAADEQLSFFTCSKDNTLRLWNTFIGDKELYGMMSDRSKPVDGDLKRNVYIDSMDLGNNSFALPVPQLQPGDEAGIKCMAYNHMRNQLAVGDMLGNIRIYQMSPDNHQYLHQVNFIEAHEGKVVTLQYSEPFNVNNNGQYVQFLVSASSDRMIHIFNAKNDEYELVQTIDTHTTSIVDAKFAQCVISLKNKHKVTQYEKQLRLYTCSTDKTLYTHRFNAIDGKFATLAPKDLHRNKIYKIGLTDQSIILAKDQGIIEIKSLENNKATQTFQQQPQHQTLSKAMLDYIYLTISQDNQLVAVNDKEKTIQIREVRQCSSLLVKFGLAESLSSLQFTNDNQFLICSSQSSKDLGCGLIYIFKVEHSLPKIKKEQSFIQSQRNLDKVIIVDNQAKGSFDPSSALDQMVQNNGQQRKFTVRDELFNTWAKSTNQNNQTKQAEIISNNQLTPTQLASSINQEDFMDKMLANPKQERRSTISPPTKVGQTQKTSSSSWLNRQSSNPIQNQDNPLRLPLNQISDKIVNQDDEQKRGVEDFIQELEDNTHQDNFNDEQKKSGSHHSISSSEDLKVQTLPDEELHRKVALNMNNSMADLNRSTLTQRTSLTMKYLIETPRAQNTLVRGANNTENQIHQEDHNFQAQYNQVSKFSKRKITDYQAETEPSKISELEEMTLHSKLCEKLDKIIKIATQQDEIDAGQLNQSEKIQLSQKLNQAISFASGVALSSLFVCNMNDVIYAQMRRNVILPFKNLYNPQNKQQRSFQDVKELGSGAANFISQLKPQALGPANARQLVMTDQNYSTPSDNYFGYLTKIKQENYDKEMKDALILKDLGFEKVVPSYYNVQSGKFEIQNIQQDINQEAIQMMQEDKVEGIDAIELARINAIRQQAAEKLIEQKQNEAQAQKHTKKDYERLKNVGIIDIIKSVKQDTIKMKFQDDQFEKKLNDVVKIEKKKQYSKKRNEQKKRDLEIQELLKNPQDINYDKAMKIYDDQPLEAKQITLKDKKRLRRLKRKAEQDQTQQQKQSQEGQAVPSVIEAQEQIEQIPEQIPQASAMKIESKVDSDNLSDENIDNLIK